MTGRRLPGNIPGKSRFSLSVPSEGRERAG